MNDKLYCAAARRCITPPDELLPHLYGLRNQSFGGVLDDIFLRVLALKCGETSLLVVSFDLDKAPYPAQWIGALSKELNIPGENISYSATHTHSAPITGPRPNDGPNRKSIKPPEQQEATNRYEEYLFTLLMETAREALAAMRPARFGWACTDSYVNISRNVDYSAPGGGTRCMVGHNGGGDVDRTLFLGKFEGEDGAPIAYLMNYAVHNCVMHANKLFDGKLGLSSDLGGNISQKLEEQYPGAVALWTSGAAGDVNPILMNEVDYPSAEDGSHVSELLGGDQTLFLRVMVGRHYADVTRALKQVECTQDRLELKSCVRWVETPGRNYPGMPEDLIEEDPRYRVRLQGLRLGDVAICGVSGELYTSFARRMLALSPFVRTLIVSHNACQMSNAQYILDDDGVARDALGYNHSFIVPGYVGPALELGAADVYAALQ